MNISIDPGLKGMAIAASLGGELIFARLVPIAKAATFAKRELWPSLRHLHMTVPPSLTVVIEKMVHYPGQPGKRGDAVANDLIELTAASCLLAGSFRPREIRFVTPQEWKGSVPKNVCQARIAKALSDEEMAIVKGASVGALGHNIWDAVGILMFHEGRI